MTTEEAIGERLYALRLQRGLTRAQVAARVGVSPQQIQKYERGISRICGSRLWRLCEILETEPNVLLGWPPRASSLTPSHLVALEKARAAQQEALNKIGCVVRLLAQQPKKEEPPTDGP